MNILTAKKIIHRFTNVGHLYSDGRPIMGTSAKDLAKLILDINSGTQTLKHVKGIIISDVRFDNEAQFIKSIGGTIVKINRNVAIESSNHQSERGISIDTDYVIENNTTIDDLYNQIDYIIYDMKHKK